MFQGFQYEIESVMKEAVKTGRFQSLCTIQAPSGVFGPTGAPDGNYVDVAGLVNIACMDTPPSEIRIQSTELKDLEEILATRLKHILLDGYYYQIELGVPLGWRAVIDGVAFDLLGAESDSQAQQTRMEVKLASI